MKDKIDELQERILAIRVERLAMATAVPDPRDRKKPKKAAKGMSDASVPPLSVGGGGKKAKGKKLEKMYHPNLKFVIAEMAYSPYLTKPEVNYTERAMRTAPQLAKIRFETKQAGTRVDKAALRAVCSLKEAKQTWEKEVKNYVEAFSAPGATAKRPSRAARGADDDDLSVGSLGSVSTLGTARGVSLSSTAPGRVGGGAGAFTLTGVPGSPGSPGSPNQLSPLNKTVGVGGVGGDDVGSPKKRRRRRKKKKMGIATDSSYCDSAIEGGSGASLGIPGPVEGAVSIDSPGLKPPQSPSSNAASAATTTGATTGAATSATAADEDGDGGVVENIVEDVEVGGGLGTTAAAAAAAAVAAPKPKFLGLGANDRRKLATWVYTESLKAEGGRPAMPTEGLPAALKSLGLTPSAADVARAAERAVMYISSDEWLELLEAYVEVEGERPVQALPQQEQQEPDPVTAAPSPLTSSAATSEDLTGAALLSAAVGEDP